MALIDELSDALKEAMKAKDKPKLDAIRQVQTEIAKKKSEKGEEATDELVLGVISSYVKKMTKAVEEYNCLLYTSPSPRDLSTSRMPSSA